MSNNRIEISTVGRTGQGYQGWSPVLSAEADGSRIVLRVLSWTGGQGVMPSGTGMYVGLTGLVSTKALAVDIRGSGSGDIGDNVFIPTGTITAKNQTYYVSNSTTATVINLPSITQVAGFRFSLMALNANVVTLNIPAGWVCKKASSRGFGAFLDISFTNHTGNFTFPRGIFEIVCVTNGTINEIYIY